MYGGTRIEILNDDPNACVTLKININFLNNTYNMSRYNYHLRPNS